MENREIRYRLTKKSTSKLTGYFVAAPEEALSLDESLSLLKERPMDDYLHQYVLTLVGELSEEERDSFLDGCLSDENGVKRALAAEYILLSKGRNKLKKQFSEEAIRDLCNYTPLIYLRSFLEPDQVLNKKWTEIFRENIQSLKPLPSPEKSGLAELKFAKRRDESEVSVADIKESFKGVEKSESIPPGDTADRAEECLLKAGVELGQLQRHESSLSPIALLRTWQFSTPVNNFRNRFVLSGEQTSYGRGLSVEVARASLMMEIVERCSAFAGFDDNGLLNYRNEYPVRCASYGELVSSVSSNERVIDPNDLAMEVSWQDRKIHWVCGEMPDSDGDVHPAWIPVQSLFLFCNPDEPALFSGLGSTGFASGNTIPQAKVSALLEIVERHQASTVPFSMDSAFRLVAKSSNIGGLLEVYQNSGVNLWFQDITPKSGIPCCRCIAVETSGQVHIGTAANLDAQRAIISAITETSCPFPNSPSTKPAPSDLMLVGFDTLPNYSTGNYDTDLAILEKVFHSNGYSPCYIDLTRADIGLPVVRAVMAGTEVLGDFDDYSRVHPDLFRNYLALNLK